MKLMYPIENKEYSSDPLIKNEWDTLKRFLQIAYYITIFGYSAPDSDVDAKALMLEALGENKSRSLSELEFIDIKSPKLVEETWDHFIYKSYPSNYNKHFSVKDKFNKSYLWNFPRRSCDAFASATLMNTPWYPNPFPEFKTISEMHNWIAPLLEDEYRVNTQQNQSFTYKARYAYNK